MYTTTYMLKVLEIEIIRYNIMLCHIKNEIQKAKKNYG